MFDRRIKRVHVDMNDLANGHQPSSLVHLGRHRLALVDDEYGQASDGGVTRIDRLVDFPLNYREIMTMAIAASAKAKTAERMCFCTVSSLDMLRTWRRTRFERRRGSPAYHPPKAACRPYDFQLPRRPFAILTRTYHGSRVFGWWSLVKLIKFPVGF